MTFQQFVDAVERTLKADAPYVPAPQTISYLPEEVEWIGESVTFRLGQDSPTEVAVNLLAEGISVQPVIHPMTLRGAHIVAIGIAALFDTPQVDEIGP